jgi:hypothetical protein
MPSGLLPGAHRRFGVVKIGCQRLLEIHMLPGGEGGNCGSGVLATWQCQDNGVHIISTQQIIVVCEHSGRRRQPSGCVTGARVRICDRGEPGSGQTLKNLEMDGLSDLSAPNQSKVYAHGKNYGTPAKGIKVAADLGNTP